jgi:hypothetical protein
MKLLLRRSSVRITKRTLLVSFSAALAGCSGDPEAASKAESGPPVLAFMTEWTKESDATLRQNARALETQMGFKVLDGTDSSSRLLIWIVGSQKSQSFSIRAMRGEKSVVILFYNENKMPNSEDQRVASILLNGLKHQDILYMYR